MSAIYYYVVTKYKPWLYLPDLGAYQGDEYTGAYDIGDEFNGKIITVADYLYDENRCIAFLLALLDNLNISWLSVSLLHGDYAKPTDNYRLFEKWLMMAPVELRNPIFNKLMIRLRKKSIVTFSDIPYVLQMIFREFWWYRLENSSKNFKIDITGEFYIHLKLPMPEIELMKIAAKYGLYVNPRNYIDGYPINVDDYRIV